MGLTLTNDKASSDVKRARRKAAGCIASGGNRCSTKKGAPKGLSCDEYPFASTTGTQRFNRCVPAGENSSKPPNPFILASRAPHVERLLTWFAGQGGTISSFYKKNCDKSCTFTIGFSGESGIPNCAKKCEIDGIVTGPGSTTPPTSADIAGDGTDSQDWKRNAARSTLGGRYRTSSGREISVPAGASIGQLVYWVQPRNATLWHLQAMDRELNSWAYDEELDGFEDMVENSILREEVVVEEIPWAG